MRAAVISYAHIATFEGGVIFIYLGQLCTFFILILSRITVALCWFRSEFLKCCIIVAAVVSSVFFINDFTSA